jgi:transcriptional regulator with XRE-family HTH domain
MADEAWKIFASAISREMNRMPKLTSAALAVRLGLNEEMIANWRRGRSRPKLQQLRTIVENIVLERGYGPEPTFTVRSLLREMGILEPDVGDQDLLDRAIRLQKLELKLDDANAAAALLGRQLGVARIAQAAIETGQWAVCIWPAYEGPVGYEPIHVSDRIDITRTDLSLSALSADDVWQDPAMKAALRSTRALRALASPRMADHLDIPVSQWSVMHVGSPRDPITTSPWPGLGALCFLAVTVDSWVNDVAALVAFAIGYGLTSTRDLTLDIYGLTTGEARAGQMWSVHRGLLSDPPRRRIWSHFGVPSSVSHQYVRNDQFQRGHSVTYVFVEEDDAMLAARAARYGQELSALALARDTLRRSIESLPPEQVVKVVAKPQPDRNSRWAQALDHTLAVLEALTRSGVGFDPSELRRIERVSRRHDPTVAGPIFAWLNVHGWPSISAGGSTDARLPS